MQQHDVKAIIGLGNPGPKYKKHRHNIGFMIVDALADRYHADWQHKDQFDLAELQFGDKRIMLIKPLTFMNTVGKIMPWLIKKGIKPEEMLVVHDELEKPQGNIQIRFGGSARGHNGLRSIIGVIGPEFYRLRFGIGRPERKEDVGNWVLSNFELPQEPLQNLIDQAAAKVIAFAQDNA